MTLITIAKKIATLWLIQMAKDQLAQKLVMRETTSIQLMRDFDKTNHLLCCQCN